MKAALLQLNSGDDPEVNLKATLAAFDEAAGAGAGFILTPEVTNCVSSSRAHQNEVLAHEADDLTLKALRERAKDTGAWCLIGSLGLKTGDPDGRFANRSFLIDPQGEIAARYDKIHMFDVQVTEAETYRESDGYRPGTESVLAQTPFATLGMSVCYDIRFPHLYRDLAQAGAEVLTIPAAFSPVTGAAHWEPLLRARAIETGCYVLAPAQTGDHAVSRGRPRSTHGHTMAISPWGEVLVDAGVDPGISYIEIDRAEVADARQRVPSLMQPKQYNGPHE